MALTTATDWQAQRDAVIAHHPMFERRIMRSDLPELSRLIETARTLPSWDHVEAPALAYLIQGEEDTSLKQAAMWSKFAVVFVLTFQVQRRAAIFFPT